MLIRQTIPALLVASSLVVSAPAQGAGGGTLARRAQLFEGWIRPVVPKRDALLAENKEIGALKLGLRPESVTFTPVSEVFARRIPGPSEASGDAAGSGRP